MGRAHGRAKAGYQVAVNASQRIPPIPPCTAEKSIFGSREWSRLGGGGLRVGEER